ncbi:hypothetical protein [Duganella sp. BuS-21]|uniref:hypothetical protein n=1 Tax=Duganella sp. BuS-21 TaxID=2943848 RepID=UPI0035A6AE5A
MPTFTSTQLQQFKLEAKNKSRATGIPRRQALDERAHALGFSNWALLMKNASPGDEPPRFKFSRSDDDMRAALRKVAGAVYSISGRNVPAGIDVPDIWDKFTAPSHAVEFAIDYLTTILNVPRFKVGFNSKAFWEMRLWLPYGLQNVGGIGQILVNRYYKPVGLDSKEWVKYEEYPRLMTNVTADAMKLFSHSETGQGHLYGLSPWRSRKAAQDYLGRLQALRSVLR